MPKKPIDLVVNISSVRGWQLSHELRLQFAAMSLKPTMAALVNNAHLFNFAELIFYSKSPTASHSLPLIKGLSIERQKLLRSLFNEYGANIGLLYGTAAYKEYVLLLPKNSKLRVYFGERTKPSTLNSQTWDDIQARKQAITALLTESMTKLTRDREVIQQISATNTTTSPSEHSILLPTSRVL